MTRYWCNTHHKNLNLILRDIKARSTAALMRLLQHKMLVLFALLGLAACGSQPYEPELVDEISPGYLRGYLPFVSLPDSLALLPPPPALDSPATALDQSLNSYALTLQGTPRWQLAAADAELRFPAAARTFSCAVGASITAEGTPHLYRLMRRSLTDAGISARGAKNHYKRQRPFMTNGEATCAPETQARLRVNGSYPSGHTAIGWAWGLILSEVVPERADALIARGRAFGVSRMICNVHWMSDVEAGRAMGAATVARLHGDEVFMLDVEAAKGEMTALRGGGEMLGHDCEGEMRALGQTPVL
ncbi:MAG: acid phosphatase (class A) [Candidatus Azotimanducaceae bacterium]|jgi:acid phosphatase (class A)